MSNREELKKEIEKAMAKRCEEEGHQMENAMSLTFQVYQICKWCGEIKSF